ncbi:MULTISPECIES: 2-C-methyl-D-erythritol 2,4-cyclodiphosphate synthase [Terrabacteria group]|uniref:2-C-methyl-D-erythritol 2,4-cyclodiphosphate synthase n=1 Tax=Bacillati TaxID=1783272 RepID=UPI001C6EE697|nr:MULTISPECIES: 2-C-methyl-D-erythritol 2,4-cyclodiphosphate synthase [Terrabacteria group]MBW9212922.1 2-C-methyl-D-erythritol 2,4-cyclodiphosphate synthase [Trueperella sp. zg.1013]
MRIGQSTDIHPFVKGRDLILGAVKIDYEQGLQGHSDADALLHAIAEAILGALGLGDLGTWFSDQDSAYKGIASSVLLKDVIRKMKQQRYHIGNIDSLILIERPKMNPYIAKMKENIALLCECDENKVNVKATRGERLGFIGRQEGAMAQAVVLLEEDK